MLNQDNMLLNATLRFVLLVLACGLPPKPRERTPEVPSAKSEFTRTEPPGRVRYGDRALRDPLTPNDVSLRKYPMKLVWRAWTPPFQLLWSPLLDGRSAGPPNSGSCRFQPPLYVRLNAWPVVDDVGAQSNAPKIIPLSTSRSLGIPPTEVGICCWPRIDSIRDTESRDTPAAWRPAAPVFSSVW